MKTLDEHNTEAAISRTQAQKTRHLTGVGCGECGEEMHYDGEGVNASNPPSRWVKCLKCNERQLMY